MLQGRLRLGRQARTEKKVDDDKLEKGKEKRLTVVPSTFEFFL